MNLGIATDDLYYTEYKFQQQEAMQNAKKVIEEVTTNLIMLLEGTMEG
jgi:hypothetical protein